MQINLIGNIRQRLFFTVDFIFMKNILVLLNYSLGIFYFNFSAASDTLLIVETHILVSAMQTRNVSNFLFICFGFYR